MTVCLAMIVRDEEAVIQRCLTSVRGLIDRYCIVDTGSSDRTREYAEDMLARIPGEWHERPWRSFGENLTEMLSLARGDWLLRLDADMTIEAHPDLREWLAEDTSPETDAWQVEVLDAGTLYRLPLLVRGGLEWRYEGVTHEYLTPSRSQRQLLGLTVTHHHDGSHRAEKFERDRELLEDELERKPDDARTIFYLACTYECLGMADEAVALFDRRASMNGWEEESWYAAYSAAKLRGDRDELLATYRRRPWRHEPLLEAARLVAQDTRDDVLFIAPSPA